MIQSICCHCKLSHPCKIMDLHFSFLSVGGSSKVIPSICCHCKLSYPCKIMDHHFWLFKIKETIYFNWYLTGALCTLLSFTFCYAIITLGGVAIVDYCYKILGKKLGFCLSFMMIVPSSSTLVVIAAPPITLSVIPY